MKTLKDIAAAVTRTLKENTEGVPVNSTDIDKNTKRPCFYVEYDFSRDGKPDFVHDYGKVTIFYFPSDERNCRMEIMDMQGKLSETFFNELRVDEAFCIPINELEFDISDDVLTLEFELEMFQSPDEDINPAMETLEIV